MDRLILERVLKTMRNYNMAKRGDSVLAAVSGGPDSVFMLHALSHLRKNLGVKELLVCNLDHGLRGKESKEDSRFVRSLARSFGLKFIHREVSLAGRKGLSTEEAAREARYAFFREAAARYGAAVVATGHTLDDQAETVLMRIIKGASLKGLVGISPSREDGDLKIMRPLIELEKREIVDYLDRSGIHYRIDRTNLEPVYFRNVVRKDIIPYLERFNPRLKRVLLNLAEHLREDFDFIARARKGASGMISSGGGNVSVSLRELVVLPRALAKEILRDCLEKAGGEVKKLSFRHWKEVEALITRKGKGSSVDLPGGIRATRTASDLVFSRLPAV